MFDYMLQDEFSHQNYSDAWEGAIKRYQIHQPSELADYSGGVYDEGNKRITLTSLGQKLWISYPEGKVTFANTHLSPIFSWKLITINHLVRVVEQSQKKDLSKSDYHQLISYKELKDGHVYYPAFRREALLPLAKLFSKASQEKILDAIRGLGGEKLSGSGDVFVKLMGYPYFPIYLKLWEGDHELPPSANMLFASPASEYLHTEDVAVLGQMIVIFIVKASYY